MVKLKSFCWYMLLLMVMTACQFQTTQRQLLPTIVQFPTATPSSTATATATFTNTPTLTHTPTQTVTSSPTASHTATHTASPTVTATHTPVSTATPTLTFTPSPSPTPIASITPIPTRTPNAPMIDVFQVNNSLASNGDPIVLRWVVQADAARLEVLDNSGNIIQQLPVELVGSYSTNTPLTGNVVTYRLTAVRGIEEVRSIVTVDMGGVSSSCTIPWFFSSVPSNAGCATTSVNAISVTFQQFQNGFMFQTSASGAVRVCGVQFDRNVYSCYAPLPFSGTPPVTPPTGSLVPDATFANAFYTQLATGGLWYDIIGWATAPAVISNVQRQTGSDGRTYYQLPNGIYSFDTSLTSSGASTSQIVTSP